MATAHDVAQYILQKTGRIQAIKLQKLCYFANGWHLAWVGNSLFDEKIKAWRYGPVVTDLYRFHKGETHVSVWNYEDADASKLDEVQQLIVSGVIEKYEHKDGFDLVRESHTHQIWKDKFLNAEPNDRGFEELTVPDMRKQFEELDEQLMSER